MVVLTSGRCTWNVDNANVPVDTDRLGLPGRGCVGHMSDMLLAAWRHRQRRWGQILGNENGIIPTERPLVGKIP